MASQWENNPAIKNFREYLRFATVHPDIDYEPCVEWLKKQAADIGLECKVLYVKEKKPVVIMTWVGTQPELPTIILNSHMDVVPVFPDSWTYPPFDAHLTDDGKIYGRGTQDMKCVGLQYLEAIRKMKLQNIKLKRTLHVTFVPDEEIGGHDGMNLFVKTKDFKDMNVGFALDEGMASPNDEFILFYGERTIWQIHVHCTGHPGHGSLLLDNTAGEKLRVIIDKFMSFREEQKRKLKEDSSLEIGEVTTVNLNQVYGGVQANVIPEKLSAVFDIRIAPDVDLVKFQQMLEGWCKEAGDGVSIEFVNKQPYVPPTKLDDSNKYWVAFRNATQQIGVKLRKRIFPAGTDCRYIRNVGLPALGYSPINNTPVLLHDHDEYLHCDVYLRGIDIYLTIIPAVANLD